jgi:hydrogenase expression/formation protein HypC
LNFMCLAIPGKIISIADQADSVFRIGKVTFYGIVKQVNLCMVPEAEIGDYVLVHVGVAISLVDEQEALLTLEYLDKMDEVDELKSSAI